MDNNKKQVLNDIMNEMVKILIIDFKENDANAKDKKLIDYKYTNHQTINATIKKCSGLCLKDYNYSILRDEVYAVVYETMVKLANEYSEDELVLIYNDIHTKNLTITNQFLTGIYKLSIFNTKLNLSGYRRNKTGMIPSFSQVEYTEENLSDIIEISDDEQKTDIIFFISWFNQNKENFLTKKQLEFLENPDMAKTNKAIYRKRIYDSTLEAYKKEFDNTSNDRVNEIKSQIKNIEKILDSDNFAQAIKKGLSKAYISDAIVEYTDGSTRQAFNKGNRDYEVIKAYRVALFKKLSQLNELLENTSQVK